MEKLQKRSPDGAILTQNDTTGATFERCLQGKSYLAKGPTSEAFSEICGGKSFGLKLIWGKACWMTGWCLNHSNYLINTGYLRKRLLFLLAIIANHSYSLGLFHPPKSGIDGIFVC